MAKKADNLLREALAGLRAEKVEIDRRIKGLEALLQIKHKPTKRPTRKKKAPKKKAVKKKKGRTWTEAQKKAHSKKLRAAWAAKKKAGG
jgi:hypothetical protein